MLEEKERLKKKFKPETGNRFIDKNNTLKGSTQISRASIDKILTLPLNEFLEISEKFFFPLPPPQKNTTVSFELAHQHQYISGNYCKLARYLP
jgi:hypothetical protein